MTTREFSSEHMLGGYSPLDGTVEFYGRINAFLKPDSVVVDLGAGRASWYSDDGIAYHRALRLLKGKVSRVIGLDVDDAVLANASTDENILIKGDSLPVADGSVDVVIADFVLEHLAAPVAMEREVFRILKPGGLFCARTPHLLHYVSIGSRLFRRARRTNVVKRAQPLRDQKDVFHTKYRCNTLRQIDRIWSRDRWVSYSYLYTAEPSYHFGSRAIYRVMQILHKLFPLALVGNIFVFKVKRAVCTS